MKAKDFNLFPFRRRLALAPVMSGAGAVPPRGGSAIPPIGWALFADDNEPGRTIRAGRRRQSEAPGPEGRERAEAPHRERPDAPPPAAPHGGGAGGGGGSGGSSGGGFTLPSFSQRPSGGGRSGCGLSPILLIGLVILVGLCIIVFLLLGGGGGSSEQPAPSQPEVVVDTPQIDTPEPTASIVEEATPEPEVATPEPTLAGGFIATEAPLTTPEPGTLAATPTEAAAAPAPPGGDTWTVMLYEDADDKVLEQDIYLDLNEAERVGSNDRVRIVAQMDRFKAGFRGDGDWSDARRYYITFDRDLQRVRSQEVESLGEVNMSDGATLADFVTWAVENYPADKYALILSDHGLGWPGGWSDDAPGKGRVTVDRNIPLVGVLGDQLYLNELDQTLAKIRSQAGIDKFELIGMDACLMGHIEVLAALAPHARYAVVSQETEPALGWAYTSFLGKLAQNPSMDGAEMSKSIVQSYIDDDQRIVDDQARAEMVGRGSPMGSLYGSVSAEQVAQEMEQNVTLTAVALASVPALMNSVNELAFQLQNTRQQEVAKARSYAQSFTSIFGSNVPPSYIDLGNFVGLLKQVTKNRDVAAAADGVLATLQDAVIAEKHGDKKAGATGVSIYFPNSQIYQHPAAGAQSYTAIANRFAQQSLWDDFLAFHYTGRSFQAGQGAVVAPERGATVRGPGTGAIQVGPIKLSDTVAAPGRPVVLSAKISGDNIGYIYFFTGFYDKQANSIFVADQDYLQSGETRKIDGVYYPDWGQGAFNLEFEWEPLMYAITDGKNSVEAALMPETYGAELADTVYTVDGVYTYADGGDQRHARLYFRDGELRQVFGFTGEGGNGAPREIVPQRGDQVIVLQKWLDLDARGRVVRTATQQTDALTFGNQMFRWKELDAAAGDYVVGFIITDLDGNTQTAYTKVTVE